MWALLRAPNLEQLWLADLREPSLALQLLVMLAPATGLAPKLRSLHLEVCESLEVYVTLGLHSKLTKLELFLDSDCEEEGMGAMKELRGLEELKVELKSRNRQVAVALCDSLYALTRLSSLCIDVEAGYVHNSITYTDQVLLCPALRRLTVNVKRRGKTFTGFAHMPSNYSELQRLAHLRLSPMLASDEDLAPIHVLPDLVSLELDLTNSQQHPCSPPSAPSVLATTKLTSLSLNGKNLGFHGLHDRQSLKSLSLVAMGISTVDTAGVAAAHTPQPSLERP